MITILTMIRKIRLLLSKGECMRQTKRGLRHGNARNRYGKCSLCGRQHFKFNSLSPLAFVENEFGGRVVIRHNKVYDRGINTHGYHDVDSMQEVRF